MELPRVQAPRVDLLGETAEGRLLHIELQSDNDSAMPRRMAEYALQIYRHRHQFPQQLVLYTGNRGHILKEESTAMPITESLLNHDLLGPVLKQGIEQRCPEGLRSGTHQGAETVLRRLMEKRFGPLPPWANTRLASFTTPELEDLSLRLLDVQTLDEPLPR